MPIDRKNLVSRHSIRLTRPDAQSPLSVGNGEFAFTADITGLQTFPEFHLQGVAQIAAQLMGQPVDPRLYSMQLGTMAQWGWHTMPNPQGYRLEDTLTPYETPRGMVTYPDKFDFRELFMPSVKPSPGAWLYANPHRLDLGRIGLELKKSESDSPVAITDLSHTEQQLDLWQGILTSRFLFEGQLVRVETICHPMRDLLAVRIESPLVNSSQLAVRIAFPYASASWMIAADWDHPESHSTQHQITGTRCSFARTLDDDSYFAVLAWRDGAALIPVEAHHYRLEALGESALEFVIGFAPNPINDSLPTFAETRTASAQHWEAFWESGAAIDLSGSTDPRAPELERRIVLSQYLTAINCAGSTPPQETGLVCNSWCGRFHLEMHWWHAAHFVLWGRSHLLERSLPWYQRILPVAQATARRQSYSGARWPKEVGPDGRESPNQIGPFLIWQQPHPIYYAELMWRARPERATLERYREIVIETAAFMASFPTFDGEHYNLSAPLIPAQESYERTTTANPTFELAYWYWGLETAQQWLERLGLPRDPEWERVKNGLAKPTIQDGVYAAIGTPPYTIRNDHPSMVGAFGFVPPTPLIDPEIMHATLSSVQQAWDWLSTWGWDYPLLAMCAARLGRPADAVDFLLMETPKNIFLPNGHNRQTPTRLQLYLPGNGGLLMAIAMMAGGWDGGPQQSAPGFPADGNWSVQAEGFIPMP